jgi:hypothetical protein
MLKPLKSCNSYRQAKAWRKNQFNSFFSRQFPRNKLRKLYFPAEFFKFKAKNEGVKNPALNFFNCCKICKYFKAHQSQ